MKLLLDQNLSPRLIDRIVDLYPGSSHVANEKLDRATDNEVWNHADQYGYIIVSKDVDFSELGLLQGFPPKVIWLRRGNCTTTGIEIILRDNYEAIKRMNEDATIGIVELF